MSKKEEEQSLLKRSRDFSETADYQINNHLFDLATFSLQQALELFLKSKILAQGAEYPKTHSVRKLLKLLLEITTENKRAIVKEILDRHLLELGILEDAYITSRYVTREFSREEVEILSKTVKEIMRVVT